MQYEDIVLQRVVHGSIVKASDCFDNADFSTGLRVRFNSHFSRVLSAKPTATFSPSGGFACVCGTAFARCCSGNQRIFCKSGALEPYEVGATPCSVCDILGPSHRQSRCRTFACGFVFKRGEVLHRAHSRQPCLHVRVLNARCTCA